MKRTHFPFARLSFIMYLLLCASELFCQPRFSAQGHRGKVTEILNVAGSPGIFWTAGEDGFLIRWENGIGEHFQLTENKIKKAAISGDGKRIALYESDGGVYHSVKIFDTASAKIRQSFLFKVPVLSLDFSKKGTYLVVTTNSADGLFVYSVSSGKPVSKIKKSSRVYSWAKVSASEKNIMLYSPDGTLSYHSLKNGSLLKEVQTEKNLESCALFSKNTCMAGIKDSAIYSVSAESGKTLKSIAAKSPLLLEGDDALLYFDGRDNLYSLYTIGLTERGLKGPLIFENIRAETGKGISAACITENRLILGSEDGKIFSAPLAKGSTQVCGLVNNESYERILDAASDGKNVFLLTKDFILRAEYGGRETRILKTGGSAWSRITYASGRLILMSENRRDGIQSISADGGDERFLWTPKSRVQKIRAAEHKGKSGFLEIESDSVNFYDFALSRLETLHSGSGIQDAVILGESGYLCVAKTASSKPASPLILVNLKTGETVPVKIEGDIAYSVDESGGYIFGVRLTRAGDGYSTGVFALGTKALTVKELLNSAKEKSDAFIMADFPRVLTNAGGKEIDVINVKNSHKYSLKAGASLPLSVHECGGRLAVLNEDSSITWYNTEQPIALADWYLNSSGEIIEF